jgi:hypothetical protein
MWRGDRFLVPSWRHGSVIALRAGSGPGAEGTSSDLSRGEVAEIIHELADGGGGRHYLRELFDATIGSVGSDSSEQLSAATIVVRLLEAVDAGRLVLVSGDWTGAPDVDPGDREAFDLIAGLMPYGRRLSFEGNVYRLVPVSAWSSSAGNEREEVVPLGEAGPLFARLKRKMARTPADEKAWDEAAPMLTDKKVKQVKRGMILLVRRVLLASAGAPPPPPPAAASAAPAPVKAPVSAAILEDEVEPEFSCPEEQAEAMQAAARDGVPFCLECACAAAEKQRRAA